jgi:hypothetical protein
MIKSRKMRWTGHVARMRGKRNVYRTLVGTQEGKKLLEKPRCRWLENIKMDLREIEWGGVDWTDLVQDRYQWRALCQHGNEPSVSIKYSKVLEYLHNWRLLKMGSTP